MNYDHSRVLFCEKIIWVFRCMHADAQNPTSTLRWLLNAGILQDTSWIVISVLQKEGRKTPDLHFCMMDFVCQVSFICQHNNFVHIHKWTMSTIFCWFKCLLASSGENTALYFISCCSIQFRLSTFFHSLQYNLCTPPLLYLPTLTTIPSDQCAKYHSFDHQYFS